MNIAGRNSARIAMAHVKINRAHAPATEQGRGNSRSLPIRGRRPEIYLGVPDGFMTNPRLDFRLRTAPILLSISPR
jgi:hypothetical protein